MNDFFPKAKAEQAKSHGIIIGLPVVGTLMDSVVSDVEFKDSVTMHEELTTHFEYVQ